jgi:hypothetical protein
MEKSRYQVVDTNDIQSMLVTLHGLYESIVEEVFRNMDEGQEYAFVGKDGRVYVLQVKKQKTWHQKPREK